MDGFLGTGASLASDLSLLAYVVLLLPAMLVGWGFARRKLFQPHHKLTMTTITVVNWVIIVLLMALRYANWVAPYLPGGLSETSRLIPSVHLLFGVTAQLLATYLVILMWTEKTRFEGVLPKVFRIRKIKPVMRTTLALWLITALLGITTYFTWYVSTASPAAVSPPVVTEQAPIATEEASTGDTPGEPLATEEPVPLATEES